jgi:hypothetical protein
MRPLRVVGTIDRRILVSYRIDPGLVAQCLPAPFRPTLRAGVAVGGVCLIRFTGLRPSPAPQALGITTENVAHRFAVEWDGPTGTETGVFVPRRDTSSRLSALLGGRAFPGPMAHGRFHVDEDVDHFHVRYRSDDGAVGIEVRAAVAGRLPEGSLFDTLDDASEFFRRDNVGYSPATGGGSCDGVELRTTEWNVRALEIASMHSSWFDDESRFPPGSIELDSALVMRGIPARWVALDDTARTLVQ